VKNPPERITGDVCIHGPCSSAASPSPTIAGVILIVGHQSPIASYTAIALWG
jgi:hypothetical protein